MNNNPYSNERANARKKAREKGEQTSQRHWDNFSVSGEPPKALQQQSTNSGEILKIVNDAIASAKSSIVAEVTANVVSALKNQKQEGGSDDKFSKNTNYDFEPTKAPMFNYQIGAPSGGPKSGIILELNFKPSALHVLGLRGENLEWIETEEC